MRRGPCLRGVPGDTRSRRLVRRGGAMPRHVRKTRYMITIANKRWPAVRHVGFEESADGEGGAWWRCDDCCVCSGRAALEKPSVHRVEQQVVFSSPPGLGGCRSSLPLIRLA
eukprot:6211939-Pleurochrysis_carterae.AAC.1